MLQFPDAFGLSVTVEHMDAARNFYQYMIKQPRRV